MIKNPWNEPYVDPIDKTITRPKGAVYYMLNERDIVIVDYLCHHGSIITGRGRKNGKAYCFDIDWRIKFYSTI